MYTACLSATCACCVCILQTCAAQICVCAEASDRGASPGGRGGTFSRSARLENSGVCQGRSPWRPARITRGPWGYSELFGVTANASQSLLCSGPLLGPQLRSLSLALVLASSASSTEPLVHSLCIIHHSSAEGARGAPSCSGRRRPWAGRGGRSRCPAKWLLRFETTFARGCRRWRPSLAAIMAVGPLGEVWGEAPMVDDGDVDIVTMDAYLPLMRLW